MRTLKRAVAIFQVLADVGGTADLLPVSEELVDPPSPGV